MKKITKKSPSKASHHKRAVKDLAVKPAKGRTVRGGLGGVEGESIRKGHSPD
jgi:hypothetical protein